MRDVATRICREYLSGAWRTISSDEIQVKRIRFVFNFNNSRDAIRSKNCYYFSFFSGGLSNFLYHVSLPKLPIVKKESPTANGSKRTRKDSYHNALEPAPCSVLLRIYGQTHGEHALETMLTESVVFTLLSERQLGPKLHGIFPGGRIEQYIPVRKHERLKANILNIYSFQTRSLTTAELANHQISLKIAEKMSEIHSLDIPVSKEPDWLFLTLNRWLNNVETIMNDVQNNNSSDNECAADNLPKKLSQIDFRKEVQWLRKVIEAEDFPVVFCHNDLQEGNILFRETNFSVVDKACDGDNNLLRDLAPLMISTPPKTENVQENSSSSNEKSRKRSLSDENLVMVDSEKDTSDEKPELMIIDFEYCAYNWRAFDIANHFLGELIF